MKILFGLICGVSVGLVGAGAIAAGTSLSKDAMVILGLLFGFGTMFIILKKMILD